MMFEGLQFLHCVSGVYTLYSEVVNRVVLEIKVIADIRIHFLKNIASVMIDPCIKLLCTYRL